MKSKFASVLFTLTCILVFGLTAKADIRGQIRVTLPFEFVVDGETLPPGPGVTLLPNRDIAFEAGYKYSEPYCLRLGLIPVRLSMF
jgi:hypothetical protein